MTNPTYLTELHSLSSYVDRLFTMAHSVKAYHHSFGELKKQMESLVKGMAEELELFLTFPLQKEIDEFLDLDQCHLQVQKYFSLFDNILSLSIGDVKIQRRMRNSLNCIYKDAHKLHYILDEKNKLKIQLPRSKNLTFINVDNTSIPLFEVKEELIKSESKSKNIKNNLIHLDENKKLKALKLFKMGQKLILEKNFSEALELLEKANALKESEKTLSMISWIHSLHGDLGKAKKLCLQAIKANPKAGAPYNDMGSLLIQEGQYQEALRWFEKAKKSKYYPNMEAPYINSARVYLHLRLYKMALNELKEAMRYMPQSKEIEELINKIKLKLHFPLENNIHG